jgi:hypothetical protein
MNEESLVPGAIPAESLQGERRNFHEGALGIVARHEKEGRPFALFLRTFGAYEYYSGRLLENHVARSLLPSTGLHVVSAQIHDPSINYDTFDPSGPRRDPRRRWLPSFYFTDSGWQEGVRSLIRRAELIIMELCEGSPGVLTELDLCRDAGRSDRTVVVLARKRRTIFLDRPALDPRRVDPFLRTIRASDLDEETPFDSFIFRDLVHRMVAISEMPLDRRLSLLRAGTLDLEVPVRAGALSEDFTALATRIRLEGDFDAAARYFAKAGELHRSEGRLPRAMESFLEAADSWKRGRSEEEAMAALAAAAQVLNRIDAEPSKPDAPADGVAKRPVSVRERSTGLKERGTPMKRKKSTPSPKGAARKKRPAVKRPGKASKARPKKPAGKTDTFTHNKRTVTVYEDPKTFTMSIDGVPVEMTFRGAGGTYNTHFLPHHAFDTPKEMAKKLVETEGRLWLLKKPGAGGMPGMPSHGKNH